VPPKGPFAWRNLFARFYFWTHISVSSWSNFNCLPLEWGKGLSL
jgi:hypothetical protein